MTTQFIKIYDSKEQDAFIRYLLKNLREIRVYRHAMYNFVVNNLLMRYRRSALGFLWSLLNPLLVMTVISVVFSIVFKQDIRDFAIYIFSGLAPWWYINAAIIGGCQTIINGEGFLKKVYLPKVLFPLVSVTTETVNFLFSIISLYILALILGSKVQWTILLLPFTIIVTYIFNLGWAILLGIATVYFRDLFQIMGVVMQALFYMIPVVYPLEAVPEQFRVFFQFNPFYHYVILFRKVIYGKPAITLNDWAITITIGVVLLLIALYALKRLDRDIIFRL